LRHATNSNRTCPRGASFLNTLVLVGSPRGFLGTLFRGAVRGVTRVKITVGPPSSIRSRTACPLARDLPDGQWSADRMAALVVRQPRETSLRRAIFCVTTGNLLRVRGGAAQCYVLTASFARGLSSHDRLRFRRGVARAVTWFPVGTVANRQSKR